MSEASQSKQMIWYPGEGRRNAVKDLADAAGLGYTELLRRVVDFGLQRENVNLVFPWVSGHKVEYRRD